MGRSVKTIHLDAYRGLVGDLRALRVGRGLRQADAGRRLGRSRQWVQKVEACEVRLDVVQFVRVCRLYGADPARLIGRLEKESSDEDGSFFLAVGQIIGLHFAILSLTRTYF